LPASRVARARQRGRRRGRTERIAGTGERTVEILGDAQKEEAPRAGPLFSSSEPSRRQLPPISVPPRDVVSVGIGSVGVPVSPAKFPPMVVPPSS